MGIIFNCSNIFPFPFSCSWGPSPHFLAPQIFQALFQNPNKLNGSLDEICDFEVKHVLESLSNLEDMSSVMASGDGLFCSLLFFILLIVWLLKSANNSCDGTERAEIFSGDQTSDLALITGRKYDVHGLALWRRKRYFAARMKYYSNSSSSFQLFRLILLSGDVEENPGMTNETRANSANIGVKVGHLNVRSLRNRQHHILIRELVIEKDFDILTISETWLNKAVTDVEVEIPGYMIY